MRKLNLYGFIILSGALFLVILYKVLHVPVTCDELPTVSFYSNFGFWEIMMYPDNIPNNHILNTLLSKCCIMLFGKEQWAIRLPNLISFLFFAAAVFFILKTVLGRESLYFLPAAILFVNPYFLDFFGLCRGYGISCMLVTLSAGFMIAGYQRRNSGYVWIALISSIGASYANFTALIFWVSATIMAVLYFIVEYKDSLRRLLKPALIIAVISLAYLALIMVPLRKIHSTNELQYWTSKGFYQETIVSLLHNWMYDSKILTRIGFSFLTGFISVIIAVNILVIIRKMMPGKFSAGSFQHPAFPAVMLLLLPVVINLLQTKILGTPNLNGRTALFFLPLLSTVFAVTFSLLPELKKKWIHQSLAIFLTVLLLANLAHRISLTSVREWSYDQNTLQIIGFLKDKSKGNQPVSIKTSWFFHSSFYFYTVTGKAPWIDLQPYDYQIDVNTPAEYYYIFAEDFEKLKSRFEVVYKFSSDRWLLKQTMH